MKIPIICYHKVEKHNKNKPYPNSFISPFQFRLQIFLLKILGYKSINQEDLLYFLHKKKLNIKKPIIIMFDDGYKNTFTNAYPVLKKAGFTAIISICANFVGKKNATFENGEDIKGKIGEDFLTSEDIIYMSQNNIFFCSHGVNHYRLDTLSEDNLLNELILSKQFLEKLINKKVNFFTYPWGVYNDLIIRYLINAGYLGAFSTRRGKVYEGNNPYELKRLMINGYSRKFNFLSTISFLYKLFFFN